jgi:hypothetical protein
LDKDRLLPGFVRYEDENGTVVYDSYLYQPVKGHEHGVYPVSGSEIDSATLSGQSTGALFGKLASTGPVEIEGDSDSEYQDDEHEYEHGHDREVERPREISEAV